MLWNGNPSAPLNAGRDRDHGRGRGRDHGPGQSLDARGRDPSDDRVPIASRRLASNRRNTGRPRIGGQPKLRPHRELGSNNPHATCIAGRPGTNIHRPRNSQDPDSQASPEPREEAGVAQY